MKKITLFLIVCVAATFLTSCVQHCKAADDNVWPAQMKQLYQPIEVVSYDVSNCKFRVISYRGHEYIVWEGRGGSSLCHSESCTCKHK